MTDQNKETKQQAGVRLANQRMNKLQKALESIGNLGAYGLDKKHVAQIDKAITAWVNDTRSRLNGTERAQETFKLE